MKTKLFLLLALVFAVMISGCAKKEVEETSLLEMESKGSNNYYLPPSDTTGQIAIDLQVGFSDVYVFNNGNQPVGVKLFELTPTGERKEGDSIAWLPPDKDVELIAFPDFDDEFLVEVWLYKSNQGENNNWDNAIRKDFKFIVKQKKIKVEGDIHF